MLYIYDYYIIKFYVVASIKAVLRKKKNKVGDFPIAIRITKNRLASFLYTGQYLDEKFWDNKNQKVKKSHPNSTRINNLIAKKLAEANEKLLELETNKKHTSAREVTKLVKGKDKRNSFFALATRYISDLEQQKKFSRISSEKPRIKRFKEFLEGREITFKEIDEALLGRFQIHLKVHRNINDRTIANHLVVIRTIYNLAIREKIIDRKDYPFGKGKVVIKFPPSQKLGLSAKEINDLESVVLEDKKENHARNAWLLSFCFAGARCSDVLRMKWTDFNDGRFFYQMGKNQKPLSMKIPEKAKKFLSYLSNLRSDDSDYLFPEMRNINLDDPKSEYRTIVNTNKKFNKYLELVAKKIKLKKPLTMHIARHSFGNISGDKIPIQMLQKLYRHSDITTTINYQNNFIYKDEDEALDSVLDF